MRQAHEGTRGVFGVSDDRGIEEFRRVTVCPAGVFCRDTVRSRRLSVFELQARSVPGSGGEDTGDLAGCRAGEPGPAARPGQPVGHHLPALTGALGVPERRVVIFGRRLGVALATTQVAIARERARSG